MTQGWAPFFAKEFPGKPYIGRGIGGQTSFRMLLRFQPDVVALKPAVVVILAGTNDIAQNDGPMTQAMTQDNIRSMVEIAQAHHIRVVLGAVLPSSDFPWHKGLEPAEKIVALNTWIKAYADSVGATYADFHTAMADDHQGLKADLTKDGVHPNEAGYMVMAPVAEKAIEKALSKR